MKSQFIVADAAALAGKNFALNPASFYKQTEEDVRHLWALKLMDAPLYILSVVRIHSAAGWKWSFKVRDFCKNWNIPERTFYRAVSKLKTLGLLHWETQGIFTVWHGTDIAQPSESVTSDVGKNALSRVAKEMPPMAENLSRVAEEMPETRFTSSSGNAPDSSQMNLDQQTDSSVVVGENEVDEEINLDPDPEVVPTREEMQTTISKVRQMGIRALSAEL